jgi:hypothetical protein
MKYPAAGYGVFHFPLIKKILKPIPLSADKRIKGQKIKYTGEGGDEGTISRKGSQTSGKEAQTTLAE